MSFCKVIQQSSVGVNKLTCYPSVTTVRWYKPRFIRRGPTKEFILSTKPDVDPEDDEMMKTLSNHYRTYIKSLKSYLRETNQAIKETSDKKARTEQNKQRRWEEVQRKNNEWNQRVAFVREQGMEVELSRKRERLERMMERDDEEMMRIMKISGSLIIEGKEKGFINAQNFDVEIDKILDTHLDYDFALDREGRRIMDTSTLSKLSKLSGGDKDSIKD